ncbi:DUF4064 domain-containing protein [Oceanobacillus halophilus]|nr:DUF4064 domain-containing protein [Oceanobacillus halophilus]
MKRTGEMLFSIIGVVMFIFLLMGSILLFGSVQSNAETKDLVQQFIQDEQITAVSVDQVVAFLENGTLYFVIVSLISIILGVVSIILLKRNQTPETAGKLLIITGIFSTLLTLFLGIFGGVAFLIAGIMIIARGKKMAAAHS